MAEKGRIGREGRRVTSQMTLVYCIFCSRRWKPREALQHQWDKAAELVAKMPERLVQCQGPGIVQGWGNRGNDIFKREIGSQ